MSEFFKNIIMGLVQGLSEFLPISSSGHLVIFKDFLEVKSVDNNQILLSVIVHLGTLLAVFIYFWKYIISIAKDSPKLPQYFKSGFKTEDPDDKSPLIFYLIMATIPAALVGFFGKSYLEEHFFNKTAVCIALAFNAAILLSSRYTSEKNIKLTLKLALLIGIAQAMAILPGISRSGSTIVLALWLGINRNTSTEFSFLLSIPVIFGASILEISNVTLSNVSSSDMLNLSVAFVAAAFSGYIAIKVLAYIVQRNRFEVFALYCLAVSLAGLFLI